MKQHKMYFTPLKHTTIHNENSKLNQSEDRIALHLPNIYHYQPRLKTNYSKQQQQYIHLNRKYRIESVNSPKIDKTIDQPKNRFNEVIYRVRTQTGFLMNRIQKLNQDAYLNNKFGDWKIFGIFDGHGENGHLVSQFLRHNYSKQDFDIQNISSHFKQLNEELKQQNFDSKLSGSTGITIHLNKDTLICANVGDSRAIMGRKHQIRYQPIRLNKEHKPFGSEKERILKAGGRIDFARDMLGRPKSPLRVWLLTVDMPGLAMTRCFGDGIGEEAGIISEPDIVEFQLMKEDHFIILGSDGFFEYFPDEDICNIVQKYYPLSIDKAADQLLIECLKRWKVVQMGRDDITFILIFRF